MDWNDLLEKIIACHGDPKAIAEVLRAAGLPLAAKPAPTDLDRIVDAAAELADPDDGEGGPDWQEVVAASGIDAKLAAVLRHELLKFVNVPASHEGRWSLTIHGWCRADMRRRYVRLHAKD